MEKLCIDNICLIPARGITAREKIEAIKDELGVFELPSPKAKFMIDLVVDDDCMACPKAVKFFVSMAKRYPGNIRLNIYNVSYVKPPFPIRATPATRINNVVVFHGIPLDPNEFKRYIRPYLLEAYVRSHPKTRELLEKLSSFAKKHGYVRCPSDTMFLHLIARLLRNIDVYGAPYCPCRPERRPDTICPCKYVHEDVKRLGHCLCGLFWSEEAVKKWINQRVQRVAPVIRLIREAKKLLEDAEVRAVKGRLKPLLARAIELLEEAYHIYPDEA